MMRRKQPPEGFPYEAKQIMLRRSYGVCELCQKAAAGHFHHRKPRRMGGVHGITAAEVNSPSNGLVLCGRCHDRVESRRAHAMECGWLLKAEQSPEETPLFLTRYNGWVVFDNQGEVRWIGR